MPERRLRESYNGDDGVRGIMKCLGGDCRRTIMEAIAESNNEAPERRLHESYNGGDCMRAIMEAIDLLIKNEKSDCVDVI